MIIWLTGPSGSGKSTAGRELAGKLGYLFADLDQMVCEAREISIEDIFASFGEGEFRYLERKALALILDTTVGNAVVALGGGTISQRGVWELITSRGVIVFLDVAAETAMNRLARDTPRPLIPQNSQVKWEEIYNSRLHDYSLADVRIDANGSVHTVVEQIERAVCELTGEEWKFANLSGGGIKSFTCLYSLNSALCADVAERPFFIICDDIVSELYGQFLEPIFSRSIGTYILESGEPNKSLAHLGRFAAAATKSGLTRNGIIVAIGGGVVTDFAGFAASVYMRGVELILVPTTLLGMVDASIGGKTALNAAGVRNLLGTFVHPMQVLICDKFLRTLPKGELHSGYVECIKMGIANSALLADLVDDSLASITSGLIPPNISELIKAAIETKLAVVGRDAFDLSERISLNLGHTFGHALEAIEPGKHTHGGAVAFGIIAAAELAHLLGRVSQRRRDYLAARCLRFAAVFGEGVISRLVDQMRADKKRSDSALRFILPLEDTGYEIVDVEDIEMITAAVESARAFIELAVVNL